MNSEQSKNSFETKKDKLPDCQFLHQYVNNFLALFYNFFKNLSYG